MASHRVSCQELVPFHSPTTLELVATRSLVPIPAKYNSHPSEAPATWIAPSVDYSNTRYDVAVAVAVAVVAFF